MNKPIPITINNDNVYLAQDLYNYDIAFFNGCSKIRNIIIKKELEETDYIYAYIKNGEIKLSNYTYPKANLYLKEEWVVKNVPKMMDIVKQELYKYVEAPEILVLEDVEKFKNKDRNIFNIEVRGERNYNKCYFLVKDISECFELPSLDNTLLKKDGNYMIDLHYKFFTVIKNDIVLKKISKKSLFLTYKGILKILFSSRTGNAESFQDWATEKLFTIQLGTKQQKDELASELIGVNSETIKNVFRTNASKTPCVYLYLIGNAKDLLDGNYNNDDMLCKFGCTNNLPRRASENEKTFKKEFNVNIELLCFSIIEARYIFDAENNIKQYFKSNLIEYKNMNELIIINNKELTQIKQHYRMIQNSYIGRYEEMHNKISSLEKELLNEKHNIELLKEKHKNELLTKDVEIMQFQIKMLESK